MRAAAHGERGVRSGAHGEGSASSWAADRGARYNVAMSQTDKTTPDASGSTSDGTADRPANRLAQETSPYLLQHAHNPVDWYPWGDEALQRARDEDKPIFLSIGYSACHWCHVMEHESFENDTVAEMMNTHYVNIKVDREERPDLDDVYMKATQALSGSGGWPMSVWLTPDLKPFHAGTYFPPDDRWGRPGFMNVLHSLNLAWQNQRDQVIEQSKRVVERVERMSLGGDLLPAVPADAQGPQLDVVDRALEQIASNYDHRHGGFGGAPKFPHADDIRLLLRHHVSVGDHPALQMAEHTLDCMARGGIYDQLGGGFHRYSTDEKWWIPHFEKMLYDNALLVPAYLEAHRITGRADFARVARECCEWVLDEMTGEHGAFLSTQDADSEGEEGKFFRWERSEVAALVGDEAMKLLDVAWNFDDDPNFEGHWVPVRPAPDADLAKKLGMTVDEMFAALAPWRTVLLSKRSERVRPGTDDKVLVAWNGLMISAMAQAAVVLDEPRFAEAAAKAADFCLTTMRPDGRRLLATFRADKAHINGTLADYAYLAAGLLDLFEADGDPRWPTEALALADVVEAHFADTEKAGWFMTSDDHEELITRPRDLFDGALPSSNGVMVEVFVRLYELTATDAHRRAAERAFALIAPVMGESPSAFARMLLALMRARGDGVTVVLAGDEGDAGLTVMRRAVAAHDDASVAVYAVPAAGVAPEVAERLPLLAGKSAGDGRATAYVCRHGTCKAPTSDPAELVRQLH